MLSDILNCDVFWVPYCGGCPCPSMLCHDKETSGRRGPPIFRRKYWTAGEKVTTNYKLFKHCLATHFFSENSFQYKKRYLWQGLFNTLVLQYT